MGNGMEWLGVESNGHGSYLAMHLWRKRNWQVVGKRIIEGKNRKSNMDNTPQMLPSYRWVNRHQLHGGHKLVSTFGESMTRERMESEGGGGGCGQNRSSQALWCTVGKDGPN